MLISRFASSAKGILATTAFLLLCAPQANALGLQDVIDQITSNISGKLNTVSTKLNNVQNDVTNVKTNVTNVKDKVVEVHGNFKEGLSLLTKDMRDRLTEVLEDAQNNLQRFVEGRDAFVDPNGNCLTECINFRTNLKAFIEGMQKLANGSFGIAFNTLEVDFSAAIAAVDIVPPRVLFPLYVVFSRDNGIMNDEVIARFAEVGDHLTVLRETLGNPFDQQPLQISLAQQSNAGASSQLPFVCEQIFARPIAFKAATYAVTAFGLVFRVVGKIITGLGELNLDPDGGIHGYVHVTIKNNEVKKWASIADGLGVGIGKIAEFGQAKSSECEVLQRHNEVMTALDQFDPDFSSLTQAVSSRASQDSVDAIAAYLKQSISSRASQVSVDALKVNLGTALGTVTAAVQTRSSQDSVNALTNTVNSVAGSLKLNITSRASQNSLDNFAALEADHRSLSLRVAVERFLASHDAPISVFYLPEAYGGLIELVRTTVADTLANNQAAGVLVSGTAEDSFARGDLALAAGDYKNSLDDYRNAYQLVVLGKANSQGGPAGGPTALQ